MIYTASIGTGQHIWIENQGIQTTVTLSSGTAQQQQSQRTGLQTGQWTAPPTLFCTAGGFILQVETEQGFRYLQVQGGSIQELSVAPDLRGADVIPLETGTVASMQPLTPMQPMQPLTPMQPLQPKQPGDMRMGDMHMQMNPMQMRMGDMELRMDKGNPIRQQTSSAASEAAATSTESANTPSTNTSPNFCSQCGQRLQLGDRFCANCGHRVNV